MSTSSNGAAKPQVDFDEEVRFAVVMYGGASLAIYINGVAQEILRLVRATAPEFDTAQAHLADEELRVSERVYCLIGRMLSRQRVNSGNESKPKPMTMMRGQLRAVGFNELLDVAFDSTLHLLEC